MKFRLEEKLITLVRYLKDWQVTKQVFPTKISYLELTNPNFNEVKKLRTWKNISHSFLINKINTYIWFKGEFTIEANKDVNNKSYFSIETFFDQFADGTCRPQGVLYLNNQIVQGIDINHYDVLINTPGHYTFYLYFYTHEFDHPFNLNFSIKYSDKRVEDAYYDYWTILEDISVLLKNDPLYDKSLNIVNEAMNLIDLRNRDDKFFTSLNKSRNYLLKKYFKGICGHSDYVVDCVAHAHIDMAWLWDLAQTHQKGLRTFATALKLMDEYPEYKYMHTSPQLFKFIQKDSPILFNKIKKKIKEGRFEIDGAMWIEPDCNLTSGESLVRQILYGKSYLKDEFNIDSKILLLPDVFGYCYQLPQILNKSGINQFITGKMGWNDTNRFPYDTFNWIGLDGSKMFTYLISTCDANPRIGIKDTTYTSYNGWMTAGHLLGTWNRYEIKKLNNIVLTTYGYGDGGGGPTREMLEKQRRYHYGLPNLGTTKITTLKESLKEIEDNFNKNCKKYHNTPTWKDELYLEYHRGTYTSVPWIKKINRELEFSFLDTELLATLDTMYLNNPYPSKKIHPNYETFLLHQFHDILPGSAIKKVYEDANVALNKIKRDNNVLIKNSLDNLLNKVKSEYIVFNPNSFNVTSPILINNRCYIVKDIPSFGYASVKLINQPNQIKITDHRLLNAYFDIKFNKYGEITSLYDKVNHREMVKKGEVINKFIAYEDTPYQYDNWEITPYYQQKSYHVDNLATFSEINEGDRQGFKITRSYYKSKIVQYIYLYNGINRVDFVNQITWKEKRQLLKIHFPLNIKCEQTRFDTQFGSIARNNKPKNKYDEAKFEVCAHKWVDMSDGKYGIALLNDSKYGYSVNGNDLALTVLKSGSYPFTEASDICPSFKFALFPHKGDYQNDIVNKEAYVFNRPILLKQHKDVKDYKEIKHSFISLNSDGVMVETVKKAHKEKAFIIRGYDAVNKSHNINLKINLPFKKAYLTDLMENNIKPLSVKKNTINLNIKPFEIFTIKIVQ